DTQSLLTSAAAIGSDATNQLVHIHSDEFEFLADKAIFRGHVRADDPQGRITSGLLTVLFAETNRQVRTIRAEQDVVIDFGETHATGDWATYQLLTDTMRLTGKPTWRIGLQEGRADELAIDRKTHDISAAGHFYLKMPQGGAGQAGFLLLSTAVRTNTSPDTARTVEIFADEGSLKSGATDTNTSIAFARGHVRVLHPEGTMSCAVMTMITAARSNRVERIVAEENVVLEQGDSRVTSERAVYAAATDSLEMTGHPAWRMGAREGRAQRLFFDLQRKEYRATQDVFMRLPAGALGSAAWLVARAHTNAVAGAATAAPQPIEISSDEFVFKSDTPDARHDQAIYQGRVQAVDPGRMKLTCGLLTGTFLAGTNQMQTLIAEQHVEITMLETNAQRVAKGDRAVYTAALELLELTGRPGVEITMVDVSGESRATGDKALYHAATDIMELLGNADVRTPWGTMTGPGIWWNRKTGQIKARGLASMTFKSGSTNKASLGLFDSNPFGLKAPPRKK
ncbi:MAG TPA: LptA/OstA family protein, partial [Verrucomicrobiae bacterium]